MEVSLETAFCHLLQTLLTGGGHLLDELSRWLEGQRHGEWKRLTCFNLLTNYFYIISLLYHRYTMTALNNVALQKRFDTS